MYDILRIFIKCFVLSTIVPPYVSSDNRYKIIVPPVYVAFSGDLLVNYSIPSNVSIPNAFIRLLAVLPEGNKEITTMSIFIGHATGSGKVSCGLIEFAGTHLLEMHEYVDGPVLTTTLLSVHWPKIHLNLPSSHFAQTTDVLLEYTSEAKCKPVFKKFSFQIDLEYKTVIPKEGRPMFHYEKPLILTSATVSDISKSFGSLTYPCELFDVTGSYRAIFRSNFNLNNSISRSNRMVVKWSTKYDIEVNKKTIFPCVGFISVLYTHPQCAGANDKIRMYLLQRRSTGSLASPVEMVYVEEKHADPEKTYVTFSCDKFKPTSPKTIGYCFLYVSISNSNKITEQYKVCKPAHEDSDGGWNEWSPWSSCSKTCGTGKRNRFRFCNNPTPTLEGRYCEGKPMEWKPCFTFCEDSIPLTPLHSPKLSQKCACGCRLNEPEGEIIGTGRCQGLSMWIINVKPNHHITLKFQYFNLFEKLQWLKVRNGETPTSDLLADGSDGNVLTEVSTTTNTMLIEFMSLPSDEKSSSSSSLDTESSTPIYLSLPTKKIHVHGFIATFHAREANVTALSAVVPLKAEPEGSIWESTVTIVGIALCGVIVLVLVIVAVYHLFIRKRQHKYAMATQQESPAHVPKSTSMNSTPSHHSGMSGIEIDYDMERPLTGQSKKHSISVQMSRNSSISSNRSNGRSSNKKRFKPKADLTPGGSPKPPTKQYSPLPSPQVKEAKDDDAAEKSSLFNTSPLLGRRPRSPKVHPSNKLKLKENVKTPVSPKETKHDLLLRKRLNGASKDSKHGGRSPCERPRSADKQSELSPMSTGSVTPVGRVVCAEINPIPLNAGRLRTKSTATPGTDDDKSLSTPKASNIPLAFIDKSEPDDARKPGSGTSEDSVSPDKTNSANNYQTTSFVEKPETPQGGKVKPRRPTSLTESYSFSKLSSLPSVVTDNTTVDDKESAALAAKLDRQNDLPKPDGQSPKTPREGRSKASTPKSVRSSRSRLTLSPSHSVTTPSDNLEMEYDDFIDYDDTYSYFDPIETEKLQWKGAERIDKHCIPEADEDSNGK